MQQMFFLLQILLLAQHVSGTTMPIIRSSRVLYSWLLPVVFGALVLKLSIWCGAEGYVCPVCGLQPANRTHTNCHLLRLCSAGDRWVKVPMSYWWKAADRAKPKYAEKKCSGPTFYTINPHGLVWNGTPSSAMD
jgi:hypothetical protein